MLIFVGYIVLPYINATFTLRSIENSDDITKESVGDDRPGPLRDKGEQHNVANELRALSTPLVIGDHSGRKNRDLLVKL